MINTIPNFLKKYIIALIALSIATQTFALDAASLVNMIDIQGIAKSPGNEGQARITLSNNSTGPFNVQYNTLNEFARINPVQQLFDYLTDLPKHSVAVGSNLVIDFTKYNATDYLRIYIYAKPNPQSELLYIKCNVWAGKFWGQWKKNCSEPIPYSFK